jgi:hypothetical protein
MTGPVTYQGGKFILRWTETEIQSKRGLKTLESFWRENDFPALLERFQRLVLDHPLWSRTRLSRQNFNNFQKNYAGENLGGNRSSEICWSGESASSTCSCWRVESGELKFASMLLRWGGWKVGMVRFVIYNLYNNTNWRNYIITVSPLIWFMKSGII